MPDASENAPSGGQRTPARTTRVVAVRYAPGAVAESRRQAHLAEADGPVADVVRWTTACGELIPADVAEVSPGPAGMPCLRCLVGLPAPGRA
ncbi:MULTISPECIES: hypothetical protein [unclassified Saccharopolyspora]|uniref:hypothetical protein n=1 Tax=unclassified Saccharopolyspora TaxID=2646250 RepID=UPI001CD3BAE4|nr:MULTISPECIES: hypothetical protein [unclassified Saccharopolyspora]MCA1191550.1 hypothetical protein [Saccharopolyspora sp. 6V]MCA1226318.1 hypothetical protein [Saccharopolyspora sp. 6M]MCA1280811.1 hypothetical protein [Saccharopolyspora sp. 7B]